MTLSDFHDGDKFQNVKTGKVVIVVNVIDWVDHPTPLGFCSFKNGKRYGRAFYRTVEEFSATHTRVE